MIEQTRNALIALHSPMEATTMVALVWGFLSVGLFLLISRHARRGYRG
jgi:hypothetical protein